METVKSLVKSLINGGIGTLIGCAFAEVFSWNLWWPGIIGYVLGWLLLSQGFWEGAREALQELKEEEEKRQKEAAKSGKENP